jgi:hypothetical protein
MTRPITKEDIAFLADLQRELTTQDTVGQADPRFWVIRDSHQITCWDEEAERWALYKDGEDAQIGTLEKWVDLPEDYNLVPVKTERHIVSDTFFMTLREAKEHIERNHYHYRDPQAYAMTAWRSPQVERLWKLLQEVDWAGVDA